MRLLRLENVRFGTLTFDEPIEFAEGLNLLIAPNQNGKSTLLTLLEWLLYGVPSRGSKRDLGSLEAWAPWGGERPRATLWLAPEFDGWPGEVRLSVAFDDFAPQLTDPATQDDLGHLFEIDRNGSWDLGKRLTGLGQTAFTLSLLSRQGRLTDVLNPAELRLLLTAELGELVEDPERAGLDAALYALDKPVFTLPGVRDNPVQMGYLVRDTKNESAMQQAALENAQKDYNELESLLTRQQQAESQLSQVQQDHDQQLRQLAGLNLSLAHFRFGQVDRLAAALKGWAPQLEERPWLATFPFELEGDLERWQGERSELERGQATSRERLNRITEQLGELEQYLETNVALAGMVEQREELGQLQSRLASATEDRTAADADCARFGESVRPEARLRYETLDEQLAPHREAAPLIYAWHQEQTAHQQRLTKAEVEQAELTKLSLRNPGLLFGVAGVLLIVAIILAALGFSGVLTPPMLYYAIAAVTFILGIVLLFPALKARRAVDTAKIELEKVAGPALAAMHQETRTLSERATDLVRDYELTEEQWTMLLEIVPQHHELDYQMQQYGAARRRREEAEAKQAEAWQRVSTLAKQAPAELDTEWLSGLRAQLEQFKTQRTQRSDALAKQKEQERDIQQLSERMEGLNTRLARQLAPVGLEAKAQADPRAAIAAFHESAATARQYKELAQRLEQAEQLAARLPLARSQYVEQWSALAETRRAQLAEQITDEGRYDAAMNQRRKLQDAITKLAQIIDQSRKQVGQLREQVARDDAALAALPERQQHAAEARQRWQAVGTWARALELTQEALASVRTELGSNLAPRLSAALSEVLAATPIVGISQLNINSQLELAVSINDAPGSLVGPDLVARLSMGAQRQLALAVRLAVARVLGEEGAASPLWLDEPLAELDDQRTVDCLSYLGQLAERHQVLFLSCHSSQYEQLLSQAQVNAHQLTLP